MTGPVSHFICKRSYKSDDLLDHVQGKKLFNFALQLLKIPALLAQLECLFSESANVHCSLRNRFDFQRSKKLIHVYYSLRCEEHEFSDKD